VGQEDAGLLFYDVADPFDPVLLADFATYGTATDIALDEANNLAYLADGGAGHLRVIDYTDPAAPFEVAVFETPGDCLGVAVEGGLAVVADGHAGVHLVDVSDPVNPALISTIDTAGLATDVLLDADESVVYVADRLNGLLAIDVVEPSLPIITAMIGMQGAAYDLARNGDSLYIARDGSGLALADLAVPTMPTLADEHLTPGTARAVAIDNHGVPHVASPQIVPDTNTAAPVTTVSSAAATATARARLERFLSWMPAATPEMTPHSMHVQASGR